MESIYYVLCWLCHRSCEHCYDERFRPYYGEDLRRVVEEARAGFPRVIANLPARMTWRDATGVERIGRVILAGGEVLLEPVREPVLYPAIDLLREKYRAQGGIKVVIQTTGDTLSPRLVRELCDRGVWMISVSGMDEYHEGIEPASLQPKLAAMFAAAGLAPFDDDWAAPADSGPFYHFFGATPDSWVGRLWPRGRAFRNELSTAAIEDNFCNRWSGGLNFLRYREAGSEVSIDPAGNVYPCCLKTRRPLGSLLEENLEALLDRVAGNPVYQAISAGQPQRMGLGHGWSVEKFLERSAVSMPSGRVYRNLCIGCDRFHEEVLMPSLVSLAPAS
jgi:hypothetical protein